MTIVWKPTLAAVDARLVVTPSTLGSRVRGSLSQAGASYDVAFSAGRASVLVESQGHINWRAGISRSFGELDRIARLAEQEAVAAAGSQVFTVGGVRVLLAPDVAMPFDRDPSGQMAPATFGTGEKRVTAAMQGPLGNAIVARLETQTTTRIVGEMPSSTFTFVLDGVSHTQTNPAQPGTPYTTTTTKLILSLGGYDEAWPNGYVGRTSLLVADGAQTLQSGKFAGGTGYVAAVLSRLDQALTLPGVSAGTRMLLTQARATRAISEPNYYVADYYQRPQYSGVVRTYAKRKEDYDREIAERQRLESAGQRIDVAPVGPTYGMIEQALVDALDAAKSWLQVA